MALDEFGHGEDSRRELNTTHPDIQAVIRRVAKRRPNTVLQGRRTHEEQADNVRKGVSKTMESQHLLDFSEDRNLGVDAVDVAPDPLAWPQLKARSKRILEMTVSLAKDGLDAADRKALRELLEEELDGFALELARWAQFTGYVLGVADEMHERGEISAPLGSGSDWDGDTKLTDHRFHDWPHIFRRV